MKIALTGATGFIGRHVVAELERMSISPILICRPATQIPDKFRRHPVVVLDARAPLTCSFDLLGRPDVLMHLAWGGLPNFKSLHHFESELPLQYSFLKRLLESGLTKILITGTCFEYGMHSGPLREDMETLPVTPYGFAKDALRRQLEFLQKVVPFQLTWARLFYLHGEGQAETSLLPQLQKAVKRGDPFFNMSRGEQLRDYLPVANLAKMLVGLALSQLDHGAVNVCSGTPVSVRALVESWIRDNSWNIQLNLGHFPYPDYEPMAFWGDRRKLDSFLCPQ